MIVILLNYIWIKEIWEIKSKKKDINKWIQNLNMNKMKMIVEIKIIEKEKCSKILKNNSIMKIYFRSMLPDNVLIRPLFIRLLQIDI